jgi:polar amino acid transport system substrate-binding protein
VRRLGLALCLVGAATLAVAQTPPTIATPTTTLPAVVTTTTVPDAAADAGATAIPSPGDAPAADAEAPLRVGVIEAPPFAYRDSDGSWTGLAVVLWRVIAGRIERKWDWVDVDTGHAFTQLAEGHVDIVLGAVAITAERAAKVDFSAPFLSGELGVAVHRGDGLGVVTAARRMFTRHLFLILGGLGLSIILAGTLMWVFERRPNPQHFGGNAYEGIGAGVWWAAVTMTTVGYGDTLPRTRGGRVIALVWMFVSIVVISLFTASIVSMVTLANMRSHIESVEDLRHLRVSSVEGGAGEDFLQHHAIPTTTYPTAEGALQAVLNGDADAAIGQVPVMRWYVRRQWSERLLVTSPFLEQQFYAIALAPGLRKSVDASLLRITETDDWRAIRERYLGH